MDQELSGRYTEIVPRAEDKEAVRILNLRVDVDGERPLNIISGDFGATDTKGRLGSFKFAVKKKEAEESNKLIITGTGGQFTKGYQPFEHIQVVVPLYEQSPDIIVHLTGTSSRLFKRVFRKRSRFFHSVIIHHSYEAGVQPLDSLDTKALDSPAQRAQPISLMSAFAEAGLEVTIQEEHNLIPHPNREDKAWTDSELKNALTACSSFAEPQQAGFWLLSAMEYVICTVKGLNVALDSSRRGCAVFQIATGWETAEEKRLRFFIYMHELGHCLGLNHPWAEDENGVYSALSWMNYPWRYRLSEEVYGSEAFWRRFNFQFSDTEIMTLRHSFKGQCI